VRIWLEIAALRVLRDCRNGRARRWRKSEHIYLGVSVAVCASSIAATSSIGGVLSFSVMDVFLQGFGICTAERQACFIYSHFDISQHGDSS
jgi:hypothetical protein